MDHADVVISLDKKYSTHYTSTNKILCPNNGTPTKLKQSQVLHKEHGGMVVHKNAQVLVCGVCGETYPTSSVE